MTLGVLRARSEYVDRVAVDAVSGFDERLARFEMVVAITVEQISITERGACHGYAEDVRRNPRHLKPRINDGAVGEIVFEGDLEAVGSRSVRLPHRVRGRLPARVEPLAASLVCTRQAREDGHDCILNSPPAIEKDPWGSLVASSDQLLHVRPAIAAVELPLG